MDIINGLHLFLTTKHGGQISSTPSTQSTLIAAVPPHSPGNIYVLDIFEFFQNSHEHFALFEVQMYRDWENLYLWS